MSSRRNSIIQKDAHHCFLCGRYITPQTDHTHEVFPGVARRKKCIEHGLYVHLCPECHNLSSRGVHFDRAKMQRLQEAGQMAFEKTHTREEFMAIFHESWL